MGAGAELAASSPAAAAEPGKRTLVFTYGTLKRGFSNHALLQDLSHTGDATFISTAATASALPLVCGPYRVPFLLNLPGSGQRVKGELYSVTPRGLARLDELEGVSCGHYERLPVEVVVDEGTGESVEGEAVAYYAHRGYAAEMWARSGRRGHAEYSPAVAAGYVRRVDWPQGLTMEVAAAGCTGLTMEVAAAVELAARSETGLTVNPSNPTATRSHLAEMTSIFAVLARIPFSRAAS